MEIQINDSIFSLDAKLKKVSGEAFSLQDTSTIHKKLQKDYKGIIEYKFIEVEFIISLESFSVSIPYIINQEIKIKPECTNGNEDIKCATNSNDKFDFFQQKYINIELFEIKCNDLIRENVFRILFLMESIGKVKITKELYERTDANCIFSGFYPEIIKDKKYKIVEYQKSTFNGHLKYHNSEIFIITRVNEHYWHLPVYDFNKIYLDFSIITDKYIYLIVPENFNFSFRPSIYKIYYNKIYRNPCKMPDSFNVFTGSYTECYSVLHDTSELNKYLKIVEQKREIFRRQEERMEERDRLLNDQYYDYKEDAYYALTDGRYGSYDDWKGNINSLMGP